MKKHLLMLSILVLLISSTLIPISIGSNTNTSKVQQAIENYNSYHTAEITSYAPLIPCEYNKNNDMSKSNRVDILKESFKPLDGPMDSAWPMYCS